jgi:two-component system, OmpR family, sensor histidine kinase MtrB
MVAAPVAGFAVTRRRLARCLLRCGVNAMRKSSAPRLRTYMLVLLAVLASVALGAAAALVGLTTTLGHQRALVGEADARMRASLRTKAAVLWFARASDLASSRHTPETLEAQSEAAADLRAEVDDTRRLATPERVVQLDNLVRKIAEFVALRETLQSEGLPVDRILDRATPALDSVLEDLAALVTADDAFLRTTQTSARRLGSLAVVLGATAASLLLLGFAALIAASSRLIERPILALNRTIEQFVAGDVAARATPTGVSEVRQITTAFNDLADRVLRHEKDRLTFLASVAHDLRGPLAPLKLGIDRLWRGPQPPSPASCAQLFGLVHRQVARLDQMVGDLLDAARIQSGELELHLKLVDLRPLVAGVADLYQPISEPCRILVTVPDLPVMTSCDPLRIEQVLINLVSNGIKYSPNGGLITIQLTIEDSSVVVTVSDEGVGIAPQERERIFQPFQRGEKSRNVAGGVGLGLSSSRKIAEAHGGRLDAESPNHGAIFRLSLRRQPTLDQSARVCASESRMGTAAAPQARTN